MSKRAKQLPARRKLDPAWSHVPTYVETYGPAVADVVAKTGMIPDENQQDILNAVFAFNRHGLPAAFEIDIIGPRQNIKTSTILMIELGWIYVDEVGLVIHTAHELDATGEAFRDLRALIENTPDLAKELDASVGEKDSPGMYTGNNKWAMHFLGDRRILYKARLKNSGRALAADRVVLDEGFAVAPSMMGSFLPTMSTIADSQFVLASSAGKLESSVLRDARDRGRVGKDARQLYVEYGDRQAWKGCRKKGCDHAKTAEGCIADDPERWAQIMPALGRRVFPEMIRALRGSMPVAEFLRELMVWWEDPPDGDGSGVIDLQKWGALVNPKAKAPTAATMVLDVAPDRKRASIGVAGAGKKGRTLLMTRTGKGTSWVVPKVVDLVEKQNIVEVALHPGTQAAVLMPALKKAGIEWVSLNNRDLGAGCGWLLKEMDRKRPAIEHVGQPELDTEVGTAITRMVGEVELWDSREESIDVTSVRSVSTAGYRWTLQDDYDIDDSLL